MAQRSSRGFYQQLNEARERCGLPTLSRREFGRLAALVSSGATVSLFGACASETEPVMSPDDARGSWGAAAGAAAPPSASAAPPARSTAMEEPARVQPPAAESSQPSAADAPQVSTAPATAPQQPAMQSAPAEPNAGKSSAPSDSAVTQPGSSASSCTACARVGVARNEDITKSVRAAVELAGGLGAIKQGDKVVIKPNLTGPYDNYHTHPSVVRGIILAVADYTAMANITVGECTALGANTRDTAMQAGILPVVTELGANFLAFDEGNYVPFRAETWKHILDEKRMPESLRNGQFDHFINAPILKNHGVGNAIYTCCMKNFVGLLPFTGVGSRIAANIHTADLAEKAAELGLFVPTITMNVVDATTPGLVNGPTPTVVANAGGLIVASPDRVACDTVAVAVLKCYAKSMNVTANYMNSVFMQPQIVRGAELGLGVRDPKMIEVMSKDVDNFADIMAQWV